MGFWKTTLASILGSILGGVLLFFLLFFIISAFAGGEGELLAKENSILKMNLSGEISEKGRGFDLDLPEGLPIGPTSTTGLWEIRESLEKAAKDENIKGIYLNPSGISGGWATLQVIRQALIDFKASGKFIYAHSDVYSEGSYYVASVADKIFLHPQGMMELNGLTATPMFLKGLLEKLEVEPRIFKVGTFKSAVEPLFREDMSEANRLQTQTYLNDMWNTFVNEVAASRKTTPAQINALAEEFVTMTNPQAAVDAGLLDKLAYEDEVLEMLKEKTGAKTAKSMSAYSFKKYAKFADIHKDVKKSKQKIAVIFAQGSIVDGKGAEDQIGGASLAAQIRQAREDSTVKAVVLRVNSPGGSALASDVIWREVVLTKKEKPFVVSMGDYAASGGYYISAAADRIFAQPNTITGSIGVFGVLVGAEKAMESKLGITFDKVNTHKMSDFMNPMRDMTEEEHDKVQSMVEQTYGVFINVVKEGRGFADSVAVDSIAQGRVWSGTRAKTIGLVDEIGGLQDAIKYAASQANLGEEYRFLLLPKNEDPFAKLMGSLASANMGANVIAPEFRDQYEQLLSSKEILTKSGVYAAMPYTMSIK